MATAGHHKPSWGLRYFHRFTSTTHELPHWTFRIFDTYIKFTNTHQINVTSQEAYLPTCPPLDVILKDKIPGYSFHSGAWNCKTMWLRFMLFGDQANVLRTRVTFVDSSASQIHIKLQHAAYQMAPANSLVFYLVPTTVLCPDGLYLRCKEDRHPCIMGSSCCQEGKHLDTSEPVLHMRGLMCWWEQEEYPFLLGQKTKYLASKFVRVHASKDEVCKVNDVCLGEKYVKVHVDYHFSLDKNTVVDVSLSPASEIVLAFKYNPFVKSPWVPSPSCIPIVYMGPPVLIPSLCSTKIEYSNKYYVGRGLSATAIITGLESSDTDFEADTCEWAPSCAVQIPVWNKSAFTRTLTAGTPLGVATFVVAERQFLSSLLSPRQLRCLTTCVRLPGGFCANAAKFPRISKTNVKK